MDQHAAVSRGGQRDCPAVHDRVRLAVPVQLVPEQVGGDDDRRPEGRQDLLDGQLVDLEHAIGRTLAPLSQPTVEVRFAHERRDDPLHHVGAGPVRDRPATRPAEHVLDEGGRRGLAVRAHHHDR